MHRRKATWGRDKVLRPYWGTMEFFRSLLGGSWTMTALTALPVVSGWPHPETASSTYPEGPGGEPRGLLGSQIPLV